MYDSVTPSAIPADAEVVAGYVDGLYRWSDADWARFPNAAKVRIAVFPWTNDGDVLDVETGDATPAQAPGWLAQRQAANPGKRFTIYCSLSWVPEVQAACQGLDYDLWIAHYTYQEHLEPGSVATQWTDKGSNGLNVDISLCLSSWVDGLAHG